MELLDLYQHFPNLLVVIRRWMVTLPIPPLQISASPEAAGTSPRVSDAIPAWRMRSSRGGCDPRVAGASRTRPLQGRLALLFPIPAPPFPNPATQIPSLAPGILTRAPPFPHLARLFINPAVPKPDTGSLKFTLAALKFTLGTLKFILGTPLSHHSHLPDNITTH